MRSIFYNEFEDDFKKNFEIILEEFYDKFFKKKLGQFFYKIFNFPKLIILIFRKCFFFNDFEFVDNILKYYSVCEIYEPNKKVAVTMIQPAKSKKATKEDLLNKITKKDKITGN